MQPNLSWRLFLFHDFIFAFKFVVTASTCTGRITAITLVRRYTDIVNIQRIQIKIGTNKRRAMSVTGGAFREPFAGNELLAAFCYPTVVTFLVKVVSARSRVSEWLLRQRFDADWTICHTAYITCRR